jgi:sortase A
LAYGAAVEFRKALRGIGRSLIGAGVLVLLFVVYQLFGTSLAESRSQRDLRKQFQASAPAPAAPTTTPSTKGTAPAKVPPTTAALPATPVGDAVAILTIPKVGVDVAIVEGVGVPDLKKGPGHYPKTPLPGQPGNTAIAGHRTTYGAPFYHLDGVAKGDLIYITTHTGRYQYQVVSQSVVAPSDVSVIEPTKDNRLTLTTCTPRFSASKRLIVVASLMGTASAPPTAPVPVKGKPAATTGTTLPSSISGADQPAVGTLSGQRQPVFPAVSWGIICALIALGGWLWSRSWKRWPAYILTSPVFLLALYVFFENFARFLPANI